MAGSTCALTQRWRLSARMARRLAGKSDCARSAPAKSDCARSAPPYLVLITLLLAKLSHSFVRETALGGLHRLYRLGAAPRRRRSAACPLRGLDPQYVWAPSCFPTWPRTTGWPFCKCPSPASSYLTDRRPLMGRGPVRGPPWGPGAWHWRGLPQGKWPLREIGTSTLPHETKL